MPLRFFSVDYCFVREGRIRLQCLEAPGFYISTQTYKSALVSFRRDYLKNAVGVVIAQVLLRYVHDPIVSDFGCFDAVFTVPVHWATVLSTLGRLHWQQIIDLRIGGEQRDTVSCSTV